MYVTDLHALLTSCGCTDKILHFQPLSQMLRTGSPFWSGDDRSMTSVDPAIFNPRRGGGGGGRGRREGEWREGSVTSPEVALPSTHSSLLLIQRMERREGIECTHAPRCHADLNKGEGRSAWSVRDSIRFIAINDTGGTVERNMFHVAIKWSG